jgi:hypothetical protein
MTKRMLSLIAGAAILTVATPLSIAASGSGVNCRIPFEFAVKGATLPAGHYSIMSDGSGVLLFNGLKKSAVVMTSLEDRRDDQIGRAKLVFLKIGERYTLLEVWTTDGVGRAVPGARKYAEVRAHAANVAVERIVILAN